MHHFNFKSLTFYGVAIGSVLLLFKVVTAYGENNLKAPPAINGRYRLVFNDLPICEKSDALILDIQQSGVYLNGFLLPVNASADTATATNPTLTGTLSNQQLSLSGKVKRTIICDLAGSQKMANTRTQDNSFNLVKMQIQRVNKERFTGQMYLSGTNKGIAFTAIPQKALHGNG